MDKGIVGPDSGGPGIVSRLFADPATMTVAVVLTNAMHGVLSLAAALQVPAPSPYMGQPVPGMTPALFTPGIVSTDAIELNGVFTPDMREFFFARGRGGEPTIFHSRLTDNGWSAPRGTSLVPRTSSCACRRHGGLTRR